MINLAPTTTQDVIAPGSGPTRGPRQLPIPMQPAAAALAASPAALLKALDMVSDAVFLLDRQHRIVDANASAARRSGYGRRQLRRMRFADVVLAGADGHLSAGLERVLRGEAADERLPALLRSKDGVSQGVCVRLDFVRDGDELLLVALVEAERDECDVDNAAPGASRDYLTDLPTRAELARRLERAERRARRHSAGFAVLFIDADGLKAVNDVHGHRAGDAVLQLLGRRLRACMRPRDFVARYGGDEFVAVIEDVRSAGEVARIARRIRSELKLNVEEDGLKLRISASVGVAVGGAGSSGQELLDKADRAMYRAKRRRAENASRLG